MAMMVTTATTIPMPPTTAGRTYVGMAPDLIVVYDDGDMIGPLNHVAFTLPFAWGPDGDPFGIAETARCLLRDALGMSGVCVTCGGPGCPSCVSSGLSATVHDRFVDFADDMVVGLGASWTLRRSAIVDWVDRGGRIVG